MTMIPKARAVLRDVVHARMALEEEPDDVEWRLKWILAVVLLRSVGYAMEKADSAASPIVREVQKEYFLRWKSHEDAEDEIFWRFIDQQRHFILKEYELGISEGPVPVTADLVSPDGSMHVQRASMIGNVYRPVSHGYYALHDGRAVIDLAIAWWEKQLAAVDREVAVRTLAGAEALRRRGQPRSSRRSPA